jgi:hypothetical protein
MLAYYKKLRDKLENKWQAYTFKCNHINKYIKCKLSEYSQLKLRDRIIKHKSTISCLNETHKHYTLHTTHTHTHTHTHTGNC